MPQQVDVLVVGAGPVGLFTANELIRHGLTCRIIDQKSCLSEHSKALGLHIRTLDIMQDCSVNPSDSEGSDLINQILRHGTTIDKVIVHAKSKIIGELPFVNADGNWPYAIDIPQDQTEKILATGLQIKNCNIEWNSKLIDVIQTDKLVRSSVETSKGTEIIETPWLIACDGGHSSVRALLNINFVGSDYKETWWLVDTYIDWAYGPKNHAMNIYLHKDGPLACFPMQNNRYRIVLLAPTHIHETPTFEQIIAVFNKRCSDQALLYNPIWVSKFHLHHRQIMSYEKDRIFFAGDAAHVHSPLGGQGLNTGIQDAYNLVWKLNLVHKNLAKRNLLDSYHTERFTVGKDVLRKTHFMTKMVTLKNSILLNIRNKVISILLSIPKIRNKLIRNISQLEISYAKSPIVAKMGHSNFKAGKYYKDFNLYNNEGTHSLQQIIKGTKHHLFLFQGLQKSSIDSFEDIFIKINKQFALIMQTHLVLTQPTDIHSVIKIWWDKDSTVHKKFNIENSTAVLFRPDKYVGLILTPIDSEQLFRYFQSFLESRHSDTQRMLGEESP